VVPGDVLEDLEDEEILSQTDGLFTARTVVVSDQPVDQIGSCAPRGRAKEERKGCESISGREKREEGRKKATNRQNTLDRFETSTCGP